MLPTSGDILDQVQRLFVEIEEAELQDPLAQIRMAEEALALSRSSGFPAGQSMSCYYIAQAHARLTDFVRAASFAKQALEIAQAHQLDLESAFAFVILAAIYANVGMTSEALELLEQQQLGSKAERDIRLRERYLNTLAVTFLNTGNYDRAVETFQDVLEIARAHQRGDTEFIALYNIGSVYSIRGERLLAISYFEQAFEVSTKAQSSQKQVGALVAIAGVEIILGQLDSAFSRLQAAETLLQQQGHPQNIYLLRSRGQLQKHQGNSDAAAELLEEALQLAREQNDWYSLRFLLQELSEIYEVLGDFQHALQCMRELHQVSIHNQTEQAQSRIEALQILQEIELLRIQSAAAERQLIAFKAVEKRRLDLQRLEIIRQQELSFSAQKERILTRLHHELRSPLTIINTSTELLVRYGERLTAEKREQHQATIEGQIRFIESLLDNISSVINAKDTDHTRATSTAHLLDICERAIQEASAQALTHDQRIHPKLVSYSPEIKMDPLILQEILIQLLTNALKFSEGNVILDVYCAPELLRLKVVDQGIGILEDEQGQIFNAFFRGSNSDNVSGNGLGLTIVRDYAQQLKGEIHVESALAAGTTITVTLPLPPPAPSP